MILAIDPGTTESAYVILDKDLKPVAAEKVPNEKMLKICREINQRGINKKVVDVGIEMIASYGMSVSFTVFETCVWLGKFAEALNRHRVTFIYRKDVKMNLCGVTKAKDTNIAQALIDRFDPYAANKGKGTKQKPGWFYGFKSDIWAAYAVGVTHYDINLKK